MNDILHTLFLDNPYIPDQIYQFCNQLPEFRKAERDYETAADTLRKQLGQAAFDSFDEILSWYLAQYSKAYYLFGLGLRQEVLSALDRAGSGRTVSVLHQKAFPFRGRWRGPKGRDG